MNGKEYSMSCFKISEGVADQLQTNYASDLRSILKTLFEVMATKADQGDNENSKKGERGTLLKDIGNYNSMFSSLDARHH